MAKAGSFLEIEPRRWPNRHPSVTVMRYAICNETFEGWDHARICATAARLGYSGLELAPFTLAPRIADVSADRRQILRRQAEDAGIPIVGLHWLLAKTEGMMLTSPDAAVRQRTADYLGELARCCRDLGGDLMVFGSPAAAARAARPHPRAGGRVCPGHVSPGGDARSPIAACAFAWNRSPRLEADFLNTCAETVAILGSPRPSEFRAASRRESDVVGGGTDPSVDSKIRRPHRPLSRQ